MECQVCRREFETPSDHEPWCPCFMRGPVAVEGQLDLVQELEKADAPAEVPARRTRRERLEARAERRREWADARDRDGDAARDAVHAIADRIPFGQPILVGHHSERGARADQRRMENGRRRAVENWNMADRHEQAAEGIERQLRTSIYSDDVDAVERLEQKVSALEDARDRVKRYNAAVRKPGVGPAEAETLAYEILTERQRKSLVSHMRLGSVHVGKGGGFPAYVLTNMGAEIRRNRARLEEIKRDNGRRKRGERGPGRPMLALFSSSCADCGETIDKGAPIVYYKLVREAIHAACEKRAGAA